ncbi:glycoside hydrolase family 6 protein [Georgenia deserti]|uniref:Glucanase n=1 Tax=Georgenia deserti TaxID=2093781 RepID=A0ABW4L508_9MICO
MRRTALAAAAALTLGGGLATPAAAANDVLEPGAELYVNPHSTTLEAAQDLEGDARADAEYLGSFSTAHWLTGESPRRARQEAKRVVVQAHAEGSVPVLVAYNLPFRDCAQYSAGGATSVEEYTAWIDEVAKGIGNKDAVVILEPDGLGIIPHYTAYDGTQEWCRPEEADPATAAAERFEMLGHAVDALAGLPNTAVYLDGTHSGWLAVGDVTDRLLRAGVERADGFFLNASNYQYSANLEAYGRWISSCVALVTQSGAEPSECGDQFWNGGPASDYEGVEMTAQQEWTSAPWGSVPHERNTVAVDSRYAEQLGDLEPETHFVIDSSRNGVGPWDVPEDYEDWCNPLDRGLGVRPTTQTGSDLLDAYLWIKVPGESDGECYRGTEGPLDPARGIVDPPAGAWFPEMADELIDNAVPAP